MGIAPPIQAELVLLDPAPQRRVRLRHGATIGSGAGCVVRLRDDRVRDAHAEIRWDGLRWILRPLAPHADLAVNGAATTWTALADRDVVRVADFLFGFRLRPMAPADAPRAETDDVAAAVAALADERAAWERALRLQRAELAERESRHRGRIAQAAATVLKERDRVAAAERAVARRAAELDRLAGKLAQQRRVLDLEKGDQCYDARQLDRRFADLASERHAQFAELAQLEALIDGAARLAALRVEAVRANRFGALGEPPMPFATAPRRREVPLLEAPPLRLADAADAPPAPGRDTRGWLASHAGEAAELARGSREERRLALLELDERRRDLAARRGAFAEERDEFERDAAGERLRLRAERDAVDRRRLWLDRAAERWAALRADGGAEDVRREWARLRSDLLAERVELLCERDRLAALEDEQPRLRRIVAKQRRLLARAHDEARAARGSRAAERADRMREAEELQRALENLVAGMMPATPPALAAPPLRIAA